jgi:hypothetical protein
MRIMSADVSSVWQMNAASVLANKMARLRKQHGKSEIQ